MANTINAITTGIGGLATTADSSGDISLQSAGSTVLAVTSGGVAVTGTMTVGGNAVLNAGTAVTIAQGGTGQTTAGAAFNALSPITTTGDLIIGNGTNSATRLAIGSNGTVLTSNGTTATWAAAAGGQLRTQLFTAPGTWTNPGTVTQVKVTVVGGGGGGGVSDGNQVSPSGGGGGIAIAAFTIPTSPVAITVGSGGTGKPAPGPGGGGSGGTSSFGAFISATGANGGGGGTSGPPGTPGSGSISAPIAPGALRTSNVFDLGGGMGFVSGSTIRPGPGNPVGGAAIAFSTSGSFSAGAGGAGAAQPQPAPTSGGAGAVGGIVLVEFVG